MKAGSRLAIEGGSPVRDALRRPWPAWPIWGDEEEQALRRVLHSGAWWYVEGTEGKAFEEEFAACQGARFGIACSSGTTALDAALRALKVGPGDEVVVPGYTFIATATSPALVGAAPIFADINPRTLNIDAHDAEARITPRTRALIAVHIAGRPADMDALAELCRRKNIALLEDAAQAHGASWRGVPVGSIGDAGTFSFQASKNVNGGEGGMITSSNEAIALRARAAVHVGRLPGGRWYEHAMVGSNYRLSEFQSAVLRCQLRRLADQNAQRQASAERLTAGLSGLAGVELPAHDDRITTHAWHLFTLRVNPEAFGGRSRDQIVAALQAEGIPCSEGYGPLYREEVFTDSTSLARSTGITFDYTTVRLPAVEAVCADTIWLPQHLLLNYDCVDDVGEAVRKVQSAWS